MNFRAVWTADLCDRSPSKDGFQSIGQRVLSIVTYCNYYIFKQTKLGLKKGPLNLKLGQPPTELSIIWG